MGGFCGRYSILMMIIVIVPWGFPDQSWYQEVGTRIVDETRGTTSRAHVCARAHHQLLEWSLGSLATEIMSDHAIVP